MNTYIKTIREEGRRDELVVNALTDLVENQGSVFSSHIRGPKTLVIPVFPFPLLQSFCTYDAEVELQMYRLDFGTYSHLFSAF